MTTGYGGLTEVFVRPFFAKIIHTDRSTSGKYHAWAPYGLCHVSNRSHGHGKPRGSMPYNLCGSCRRAVQ